MEGRSNLEIKLFGVTQMIKLMRKKLLLLIPTIAAMAIGVVGFSAFEAHVINVTAHIENALAVNTKGIQFGTVFPQEYITKSFNIALSSSFLAQDRAKEVTYKLTQKDKPWTLNFGDIADVNPENRSLLFVDPDPGKGEGYATSSGKLTITTGIDIEDLYGPGEPSPGTDYTAPRMVIPMGGNFTIETKVTATPHASPPDPYQGAGILVYGSDGNLIRLELTNFSGLGSTAVYMENQIGKLKVGKGWNGLADSATIVYLKVSRNNNTFKGEYSLDGTAWNTVTLQTGTFDNASIGVSPEVGLAVVTNQAGQQFHADFDYVAFNKDYLSLCKFLSKTPIGGNDDDVPEPSYFIPGQSVAADACATPATTASGSLSKDHPSTGWTVDLKVPPVSGYVGQDWPASCAQYEVPKDEADYGCDIWVEVTGITPTPTPQ